MHDKNKCLFFEKNEQQKEYVMSPNLMNQNMAPILSLAAGILVLAFPRLLNYVVAIYLIVIGVIGLLA